MLLLRGTRALSVGDRRCGGVATLRLALARGTTHDTGDGDVRLGPCSSHLCRECVAEALGEHVQERASDGVVVVVANTVVHMTAAEHLDRRGDGLETVERRDRDAQRLHELHRLRLHVRGKELAERWIELEEPRV